MSENWNTLRAQLETFSYPFPSAAITFANQHREELAPYLVDVLEQMILDPSPAEDSRYALHFYAMHLLAAWRDTRAYEPLATLGHLPDEIAEFVLGDMITDSYGHCLASVCDGDLLALRDIFEDEAASIWSRGAALTAWTVRVLEGDSPREELLAYLMSRGDAEATRLRKKGRDFDDNEVLDVIASVAADIAGIEMLERIKGWFADDLLDSQYNDEDELYQAISVNFRLFDDKERKQGGGYIYDVKEEMCWWPEFDAAKREPHPVRTSPKVGRNEPCPCGSGKKYKKCHGEN